MEPPVALVTGAARGIGAATTRRLVEDGWRVVAADRCADDPAVSYPLASPDDLDRVCTDLGDAAIAVEADVRDASALDQAVAIALEEFGRLDAAIGAAGVVAGGPLLWETTDELWDTVLDTDLGGLFHLARSALPAILEAGSGRGRFVAVASAAGSLGLHRMAAYSTAKHGAIGLVRSLAADLAGTGVTANAVSPGSTRTPILEASASVYELDSTEEFVVHQEPLGRLIEPSEVAAAIGWLCSEAASGVTGAIVPVDGGMTATN